MIKFYQYKVKEFYCQFSAASASYPVPGTVFDARNLAARYFYIQKHRAENTVSRFGRALPLYTASKPSRKQRAKH
jgi:hypothetical protein